MHLIKLLEFSLVWLALRALVKSNLCLVITVLVIRVVVKFCFYWTFTIAQSCRLCFTLGDPVIC